MQLKQLTPEQLRAIKVGDIVTRNMCGIRMKLKVTKVDDTLIYCSDWTFFRSDGTEYDDCIQLPPPYVISVLEEVNPDGPTRPNEEVRASNQHPPSTENTSNSPC